MKISDDNVKGFAEDEPLFISYNSALDNGHAGKERSVNSSRSGNSFVERDHCSDSLQCTVSARNSEDDCEDLVKESFEGEHFNLSESTVSENDPLRGEKHLLDFKLSGKPTKPLVFKEAFAEVWLDGEWIKVEVLTRQGSSEDNYLVERVDRCGSPFEDEVKNLLALDLMTQRTNTKFGSVKNIGSLRSF